MKTKPYVAAIALVIALAGCGGKNSPDADSPAKTNSSAGEVKAEIREAVDASKTYAVQSKDQFVDSMNRKLAETDQKMGELGKKIETLDGEAKTEANKVMATLREQRAQLGLKLDDLKKSGQEIGQEVKAGFESAAADLEKAYENIKSKFKD